MSRSLARPTCEQASQADLRAEARPVRQGAAGGRRQLRAPRRDRRPSRQLGAKRPHQGREGTIATPTATQLPAELLVLSRVKQRESRQPACARIGRSPRIWQKPHRAPSVTAREWAIQIGVAVLGEVALLDAAAAYGDCGQADGLCLLAAHLRPGSRSADARRGGSTHRLSWLACRDRNVTGKGRFDVSWQLDRSDIQCGASDAARRPRGF
jgi:hypothetical protein